MINRYTVIGQPIAHSVSPAIHHLFGELTQRRLHYTRTEATTETFETIVKDWQSSGGKGCNVTAPFKELAAQVCDRLHVSAKLAGAVNTIEMHRDGSLVGHNTDGTGLLRDIEKNKGFNLAQKRILMVGAGGAARGTIASLLSSKPATLHIANRTVKRAEELTNLFEHLGPTVSSSYQDLSEHGPFDLIINATSMAFDDQAPPLPQTVLHPDSVAYDLAYSANSTPFLDWCKNSGIGKTTDGFGMLVEQAADAYLIWEGVRPKTRKVFLATSDIINSVAIEQRAAANNGTAS